MISLFSSEYRHLSIIAFLSFVLVYTSSFIPGYGYFIDEFYYFACANHPAFGYVDHPPFAPLFLMFYKFIFGESVYVIRFVPALAGAGTVFLTGVITKKIGGNKSSQMIASFCVFVSPLFSGLGSFYSMNAFEPLLCAIAIYLFVKMINENNSRIWIYQGFVFGLLLMNKHTAGLFIAFAVISILFTEHRKLLYTRNFIYCVLITALIFLPNIIWQILNGFPSLEFYFNNITKKNVHMPAAEYIITNMFAYNPVVFLVTVCSAVFLVFSKQFKMFRVFGILFILTFVFFLITKNGRVDRSAFAYISVLPVSAVLAEYLISKYKQKWVYAIGAFLMLAFFAILIPVLMPFLSYENSAKLTRTLGLNTEVEKGKKPLISQMLADRIGWQEKVDMVGNVYLSFPEEKRNRIIVIANNYGNAGALELLGKKYGFKNVVSGHNNYYLWSKERLDGDVVLRLIERRYYEDLKESYEVVDTTGVFFDNEYCSPHERGLTVFVCRKPKIPETELLERRKSFY